MSIGACLLAALSGLSSQALAADPPARAPLKLDADRLE